MKQIGLYFGLFGMLIGVGFGVVERFTTILQVFGICIAVIVVSQAMYRRRRVYIPAFIFVLAFAPGVYLGTQTQMEIPQPFIELLGKKNIYSGVVVAMPDLRETNTHLTIEIEQGGESTRINATAPTYPEAHVGNIVKISGIVKRPKPFDGEGGRVFPYDMFLAKDSVFGVMSPAYVTVVGESNSYWLWFLRALEIMRDTSTNALNQTLPEPESALASGILIGGKQGLGKNILDEFLISGMLQIVVLSGYNVMIVAEGILRVLKHIPKKISASIASASIIIFVLIAGAGSSAIRAGIMALFALTARATGRTYDVTRILFVALTLMVMWSPLSLIYDPGLQFSFMATLGLILGTPIVTEKILFIKNSFVCELVATTIAAQVGVLPLLLWQTGNLSLISFFANVLAMPVIPFAMAASAVAGVITFITGNYFPMLSIAVGIPAYLPLWYVITIASVSASIPYANIILPAFSFWFVVLAYLLLGIYIWRYTKRTAKPPGFAVPVSSSSKLAHPTATKSRHQGSVVQQPPS